MRRDGKRVKVTSGEYAVISHIMPHRNDAMNMITLDIPSEPIQNYLNAKRKEGIRLSHLSVILAAYTRVVAEFPFLNRFVVNKTVYARNELAIGMVVLKSGQMDNGTMSKIKLNPADSLFDVDRKMNEYIEKNRQADDTNSTDKLVNVLLSIPGLLRFGVCAFKVLDKFGLLPRSIIDASPFHASMTISNLASIRTNHIYHHIYNFGTTSVLMTMGNSREIPKRDKNGEIYFEKCIPFGVVLDERICSGSYYALAFRKLSKYLADPTLLETPPENPIFEVPYRKK